MLSLEASNDFKSVMRGVASTVHVVSIFSDGKALGMTTTAVSSLSIDPPSLLVCINRTASMHAEVLRQEHFCLNVLKHEQSDIARRFSDSALRDVRFERKKWALDGQLAPRLIGAQASLICRRDAEKTYGTHTILIGEVVDVMHDDIIDPLLYLDRDYRRFNV